MIESWILYGLGAAISFSAMALVIKKLLVLKISPLIVNTLLFGLVTLGYGFWIASTDTKIEINLIIILFLILAGFFSILSSYFDVVSMKFAPNPGYSSALKASSLVLITIFSVFLFSSDFSLLKFIGIIIVVGGIFLISK
ncbi:MAG: EamA family transporter [archaeon]